MTPTPCCCGPCQTPWGSYSSTVRHLACLITFLSPQPSLHAYRDRQANDDGHVVVVWHLHRWVDTQLCSDAAKAGAPAYGRTPGTRCNHATPMQHTCACNTAVVVTGLLRAASVLAVYQSCICRLICLCSCLLPLLLVIVHPVQAGATFQPCKPLLSADGVFHCHTTMPLEYAAAWEPQCIQLIPSTNTQCIPDPCRTKGSGVTKHVS